MSLFKTFSKDKFSGHTQLKHSVQRSIRAKIAEQYPWLDDTGVLDVVLPKKAELTLVKLPEHVQLLVLDHVPLFFSTRDGGWFPTLRLLHKYPDMMPRLRCDVGATKFMLSGANIMAPGLTSPGATIHDELPARAPVSVYAEGKEHAVVVGFTAMSTDEMRAAGKGVAVENLHSLADGLWRSPRID